MTDLRVAPNLLNAASCVLFHTDRWKLQRKARLSYGTSTAHQPELTV